MKSNHITKRFESSGTGVAKNGSGKTLHPPGSPISSPPLYLRNINSRVQKNIKKKFELSSEELLEIKEAITTELKKAIEEALPREWLTKEQLCREFDIKPTTLWALENDLDDPLIYSSLGAKKHLYHRPDINAFLERRKRNLPINFNKKSKK